MLNALFMPFFYGVKLKIEFLALNQLQSYVQANAVGHGVADHADMVALPHRCARVCSDGRDVEGGAQVMDVEKSLPCHRRRAHVSVDRLETETESTVPKSTPGLWAAEAGSPSQVHSSADTKSNGTDDDILELERQYLGRTRV